jgi:hypothetical protein
MINPRSAINFFKTPAGAFILFCLILAGIFFACQRWLPGATKVPPLVYSTKAAADAANQQTLQSFQNTNYSPVMNLQIQPVKGDNAPGGVQKLFNQPPPKVEVLPISLFAETPEAEQKTLGKNYAPFGRLIPCELIVTVDSSSIQTPIIGLVTEDIYHAGRLIISAGTEVHGRAQTDRTRERIASGNSWTLVWRDGEELPLSGIALDREANPSGDGWAITDGSAGLRGRVLKSDDMAEIKLFAASFLSGAAGAFTDRQNTVYGSQIVPTLKNAPLQGAQNVIQAYAQQIYDSIQRDGFYVRVPAGKQFYLYVTQTIDESEAVIGGTRFSANTFAGDTNQMTASVPNYFPPNATAHRNGAMP